MIVDSHFHVKGGDVYRRQCDSETILRLMDEAHIDRACVFAICLPSYDSNEMTRNVACSSDRLIPFAHIVVEEGMAARLELQRAVEQLHFRGLKLHCGEVRGSVTPELFLPFLEQATSYRLPIIFDCVNRPELALTCAKAVPQARLLIAHLGSPSDQFMVDRFIEVAYHHDNIWLETSYSHVPWKIADALRVLGPSKLIFGSDSGGDYYPPIIELAKVRAYVRNETELEQILGTNMQALLSEVRVGQLSLPHDP